MSEVPPSNSNPESAKNQLQKALDHRPNREELVERNILPKSNVAPSLMAAQKELERSKLEDSLNDKIKNRPTAAELVKEGILSEEEAPPA